MTSHWEFTLGAEARQGDRREAPIAFLAQNIRSKEWQERSSPARKMFEKGGVKIAVIGQAMPRTPIANPALDVSRTGSSACAKTRCRSRSTRRAPTARRRRAALAQRRRQRQEDGSRVKGIDVMPDRAYP
jgi:hypothetical protein